MADMTMKDLSRKMREIDFAMLVTRTSNGALAGRPMSNNRDVDYTGDSYYFANDQTRTVSDIEADPNVSLSFQGSSGVLGQRPLFVSVEGTAELIRDKAQFKAHWTSDLDRWFPNGVDTPGVVMIRVRATRMHYWNGMDEGEVTLG
ncbi:pyridoxamine 5'-phosphate oxidase family protein [Tistrella bauzanensis]|uniref:Pyridoxamine 5'-phosphate oxidase family protein n=1 Tax=Tistrella arctica TaxID=3133430 RepID=A0ABU9YGL3_9PROT